MMDLIHLVKGGEGRNDFPFTPELGSDWGKRHRYYVISPTVKEIDELFLKVVPSGLSCRSFGGVARARRSQTAHKVPVLPRGCTLQVSQPATCPRRTASLIMFHQNKIYAN